MKRLFVLFIILLISGCAKPIEEVKEETKITGGEIMGKNILMIVAPEGFRDEELFEPKKVFEDNGNNVVIASKGVSVAKGKLGGTINVDKDVSEINLAEYDAVVFIGGPGSNVYFDDTVAHKIATDANSQGKIVAAICIAPSTLANAGLLNGKKATAFSSEQSNLENKGATYTGDGVTQDGNIITANGPGAARDFGLRIVESLK